jgi:YD repeat-containing protein
MRILNNLVPAAALLAIVLAPTGASAAETFTYDVLGRLVTARSDNGATRTFVYDRAGNLMQILVS